MLVLCHFSSMADRRVCGSAMPSPGTPYFRRLHSSRVSFSWPPSFRGSAPSLLAHPFDGDSHFVFVFVHILPLAFPVLA